MRLNLLKSGSVIAGLPLGPGWNYHGGPFGCMVLPDGAVAVINGVADGDGVGHVYFDQLELICDGDVQIPPRMGWVATGNKVVIGTGNEMLPAQSCLVIRTHWQPARMQHNPFAMHGIELPLVYADQAVQRGIEGTFLTALRSGQPESYTGSILPTLFEPNLGLWRPQGKALADATYGGGWGIEPISGWERSATLALLRSDLAMERQRTWCVRAADGMPVKTPQVDGYYSLSRGMSKTTILPRFCEPVPGSGNPDDRQYKRWNSGTCPYESKLTGLDYYNGFPQHDGQHAIRFNHHLKAAVLIWNDYFARYAAGMMAQEFLYAWPTVPLVQAGQGHSRIGLREWAWGMDVLALAARSEIAMHMDAAALAQMQNGQIMRMAHGTGWAPIPDPWVVSPDVPIPLPTDVDAAASMEGFFTAHALAIARRTRNAKLLMESALDFGVAHGGAVPTFFGVAKLGIVYNDLELGAGKPNYFPSIAIGQGGWLWGADWLMRYCTHIPTPTQGKATSITDAYDKLSREETGRSQTVAWMSAVEKNR